MYRPQDSRMIMEESVSYRGGPILEVARNFPCPDCGRIQQSMGNHCTVQGKDLEKRFPKKYRRLVSEQLPSAGRKILAEALAGKRIIRPDEEARWIGILKRVRTAV